MSYDYLVIGAGLSGAVAAERLANKGRRVLLVEKRKHIGGNVYDEFNKDGILVHKYGPHVFHTNNKRVFDYLSRFTEWKPYEHKVMAFSGNNYYPFPINRVTINKVFSKNLKTIRETQDFVKNLSMEEGNKSNNQNIIIKKIGRTLFEKFYLHYSRKQWGKYSGELFGLAFERIPVRFNSDSRYFQDKFQFMPAEGFTRMIENILRHKYIDLILNTDYKKIINKVKFDFIICTASIDYFFDFKFGKLNYRSIKFKWKTFNKEHIQPAAVINYTDPLIPYTRTTEYKYITGQQSEKTTIGIEFPMEKGERFYPVLTGRNKKLYNKYKYYAGKISNLIFLGRLGQFKYLNMDQAVLSALKVTEKL